MARYDDLNTGAIAYAAVVSSVLLLVLILLFRALCYGWIEGEDEAKLANSHYVQSDAMIGAQKERVDAFAKEMVEVAPPVADPTAVEPEAGVKKAPEAPTMVERLHIPLQHAKELLLKEMASPQTEPST